MKMKHIKKVSVVKAQSILDEILALLEDCFNELLDIIKKDGGS
jgi:hypothetical protein